MDRDEMRKNIRENLIELRIKKGITQTELAKIIGKSANAVASWEQGLSLPDVTMLYRLAAYYGKLMEYFYENHKEEL